MGDKKTWDLSRILGIVFGVLIMGTGIYSMFTPLETYGVVGWLIACSMIVDGAAKVAVWYDARKLGVSDTWALVGGSLSAVCGVWLAGSMVGRMAADVFIAYLAAAWLLAAGCIRIARSFTMRDIHKTLGTRVFGANWDLALIMGIIMVVLGVFCLANPVIMMVAIGWQIGFSLIVGGLGLITATA